MRDANHVNCSRCGYSYDVGPGSVPPNNLCLDCEEFEEALAGRFELPPQEPVQIIEIVEIGKAEYEQLELHGCSSDEITPAELESLRF